MVTFSDPLDKHHYFPAFLVIQLTFPAVLVLQRKMLVSLCAYYHTLELVAKLELVN